MSYGYDAALCDRIIKEVEEGSSARKAGERFDIGVATAVRWVRRWREIGSPMDPPRKSKGSPLEPNVGWLVALRKQEPDLRLIDIAERLHAEHGISAHKATLSRLFRRQGITFKKRQRRLRKSLANRAGHAGPNDPIDDKPPRHISEFFGDIFADSPRVEICNLLRYGGDPSRVS